MTPVYNHRKILGFDVVLTTADVDALSTYYVKASTKTNTLMTGDDVISCSGPAIVNKNQKGQEVIFEIGIDTPIAYGVQLKWFVDESSDNFFCEVGSNSGRISCGDKSWEV